MLPIHGVRLVISINPNVRILIIVRDPVDRAWSQMRMYFTRRMNFSSGRIKFDLDGAISGEFQMRPFLEYTDYARTIPRWESLAAPGCVKVILYDQIQQDPHAALDDVFAFMRLSDPTPSIDLNEIVFAGDSIDLPPKLRE